MKFLKQFLTGMLVLLPIGLAFFLPLAPLPVAYSAARKAEYSARQASDKIGEMAALQTELSYTPWQGDEWQRLGRLHLDLKQFPEAIASFSNAEKLGALSTEGRLWMADALISNGQKAEAKDLLREFSLLDAGDGFLFLQAGLLQRSLNDTYGALASLLKGYEVAPENGEINYQIGLLLSAGEPEEALPFLERAANLNPDRQALCSVLSEMIEASSEMGETGERYLYIGQVLSTYVEWDVAQKAFQKATDLSPTSGVAWALLAEAAQQNGEDGSEFMTKAQQLEPEAEMVNGLSALYYRRQGKSELALLYLHKALQANPSALVWEIETGNTLAEMGNLSEALLHYQAATEIDAQDWTAWRALAAFCLTHNYEMEEVGLGAARQALKLNPESPVLMDLLGAALLQTGSLDEAEYYFLAANRIDPHQAAILIHLGQLYLQKVEPDTAFEYLRQAQQYAQDERLQQMAQQLLAENGAAE